eukprot:scaffold234013_cov18-Tisochrysis_lutea.AAC.1
MACMATEVDDTDAGLSGHGNTKRNKWTGKPGFMCDGPRDLMRGSMGPLQQSAPLPLIDKA